LSQAPPIKYSKVQIGVKERLFFAALQARWVIQINTCERSL
jgi:hypothetical protein